MQKQVEAASYPPCGGGSDFSSLAERSAGSDAKCRKSQQRRYLPAPSRAPDAVKCRKFKGRKGRSIRPEPASARIPPAHRRGRLSTLRLYTVRWGLRQPGPPVAWTRPDPSEKSIVSTPPSVFATSYFHGTKADLRPGDLVKVGHNSNFGENMQLSWVYFSGTLDAAIWGAELARGQGCERIYVVEPTGPLFDDPNLTDKKFPGNPSQSYRSRDPLRVVAEVVNWTGHLPEQVKQMLDGLARLAENGAQPIID
jgi:hypothetical protein